MTIGVTAFQRLVFAAYVQWLRYVGRVVGRIVGRATFALTCLALSGCLIPEEVREYDAFIKTEVLNNPAIVPADLQIDNHRLHYRSVGQATQAVAVWIHGTPGSWSDIGRLLANPTFTAGVRMVSFDRPGWGQSANPAKDFRLGSFAANSAAIGALLRKLKQQHPHVPLIIVGHSWGGSIVPTIALDHPDLVDGAIILAASLDPSLTEPRWYNRIAALSIVNFIIGEKLRGANTEVFALAGELERQRPRLAGVTQPLLVIQGDNDKLVNPENADFAEREFNASNTRVLRLPNQGHLLQVERTDLIGRCILAVAKLQLDECKPH